MSVMDVVGTIGAIWLAVSILLGIAWALGGKRIFRQPPPPPARGDIYEPIDVVFTGDYEIDRRQLDAYRKAGDIDGVVNELKRRERMNGGA